METYSLDRVKAAIILDVRRPRVSGLYPIRYRVTYNRKSVYFPCMDLTGEDWDKLPTARGKELVRTREIVQSGFKTITQNIEELYRNEGFSLEGLAKRLSKGRKDSILTSFNNKIEEFKRTGQIGSAITYQCAVNHITKYTSKDLKFSDISIDWLKKYEASMLEEGKTRTTVKFYIGCLRALMNEARQDKLITEAGYPFGKGKFEIKTGTGRKLALALPQIKKVLEYPLQTDFEKRCRDLWFFSYLCNGANFHDLLKLKYKDIAGGEIHFTRQKTIRTTKKQKEVIATLLPEMQLIINKWGNPSKKKEDYLFAFLSNGLSPTDEKRIIQNVVRLVNKKMAKISKALGYDPISTYTARHSYATVLKRSGANISFISESLGHSDIRTTEKYLASFESEERAKNAQKLINFNNSDNG